MPSKFDSFSIEIFHMIFDYLQPFDLFRAFTQINSYIDTMLYSYSRVQLNCKSMKKSTFDYICEHIYPHQLQSLVLIDDQYTPGQIKLFMSTVPLIKCNNLEVMKIIKINDIKLLCLILSHLDDHPRLRSLTITDYYVDISRKNALYIIEILARLLCLKYLTCGQSSMLTILEKVKKPLLKLTHLTIDSCCLSDLISIFPWVPNLIYLNITVPFGRDQFSFDSIPLNLSSLIINSQRWFSFSEVENILSLTKSLKCFVFSTNGELDLLNARLWETLIKNNLSQLTKFELSISPVENNITSDDVLLPFENTFWKNEKHWHMACLISLTSQSCARLYSIPYFTPTDSLYPADEGFHNRSLNSYSFNDHFTDLIVYNLSSPILISSPFINIRNLSLQCDIYNINELKQIVNLLPVQHLILNTYIEVFSLYDVLKEGSNIYKLSIGHETVKRNWNLLTDDQNRYEQIKELYINEPISSSQIDQLCQKFPKLQFVSLYIKERNDIFRILKGFHQLLSATIYLQCIYQNSFKVTGQYLIENGICDFGIYYCNPYSFSIWMD